MEALTFQEKEAIRLKDKSKLSFDDAASYLGLPRSTFHGVLQRARYKLNGRQLDRSHLGHPIQIFLCTYKPLGVDK